MAWRSSRLLYREYTFSSLSGLAGVSADQVYFSRETPPAASAFSSFAATSRFCSSSIASAIG